MNWHEIRPLNGSQNDGFEELVCQLANKETIPDKKQFIRNGKPDAGVECYWVLNDDKEVAWQAKYFTSSFSTKQWGEIDSSVRTALDKHSKLTKYIIAFPTNPPDARLPRQESMREKWDNRVLKWQKWAAQKNMSVEFIPWWESDIIQRLQLPDNAGMFFFWFHKQEFTSSWFNNRNNKSIEDLGVRYSPELNVELDITKIFDGLSRNEKFAHQFYSFVDELLIAEDNVIKYAKDIGEHKEDLITLSEKIRELFSATIFSDSTPIPIGKYLSILKGGADLCNKILSYYSNKEDELQKQSKEYRFYHKYGTDLNYVQKFQGKIESFCDFINGISCKLANSPVLLLEGEAGIGKSHLFADIVKKRTNEGCTSLFLLGQYFVSKDAPWTQIKRICDINCDEPEFWGALNAKAQAEHKRAIIFIDATNEGKGKYFWNEYINSFITSLKKYKWLGIALSVRSSYAQLLFPKEVTNLIRYVHNGFYNKEDDAIHKFFHYYEIPLPDTPILQAEFQNPLFLKLYCEGCKNNGSETPAQLHDLSAIFNNYISGVEKKISLPNRLDYNSSLHIVNKAINTIIDIQIKSDKHYILYEKAYQAINYVCDTYRISNNLLEELISEGVFTKNTFYDGNEYIYFSYERLGDFLIAQKILKQSHDIEAAFEEGGELFYLVQDGLTCQRNQGLIEAFFILIPSLTGKEFYDYIPHIKNTYIIAKCFINSWIWRDMEQTTQSIKDYLISVVPNNYGLSQLLWKTCLTISTIPNHAFNAMFLHKHLAKYSLADRDAWWIPLLYQERYDDSPVFRLVKWAWSTDEKSHINNESIRLAAVTLSWFLASTNRNLRDSSTKGLVCLLANRIPILIEVLKLFEGVNEPYIYERLFAVAFGCSVRAKNIQQLKDLCQYIYETIFKDKEEVYPHILLRDYARECIEFAYSSGIKLSFDINEVRPPYHSIMPKMFPSNEEIDTKYKLDYQSNDFEKYHYSQNAILHSMITEYGRGTGGYGDFGRYVFQAGLSCFNVNYDGLSNYAVHLIFEKYGYDKEKHGKFDSECKSDVWRNHNGVRNERIGKKYQWLAFYELLARVSDNCQKHEYFFSDNTEPYNGPWNPYVRDIDPTILIRKTGSFHVPHPQYWWEVMPEINMNENNKTWTTHKDDLPSPDKLIDIFDYNGEEWLALEYHPEWNEEKHLGEEKSDSPKKRVWYQIRSYIVKGEDYQKIIDWINGKNFRGRWMPEGTEWHELFNREYYWSPGFQEFNKRYIEETKDSEEFQLNDNQTGAYIADCHVTTKSYYWEEEFDYSKKESFYITIPSKLIYNQMHLHHSDKEGVFVDADNNLICFDPSVYYNSFSALLIKKQPFLDFLKTNKLKIIWTLLSQKQIIGGHRFTSNDNPSPLDISGVYYLDDDYKVQGEFAIHSPLELECRNQSGGEQVDVRK